MGLIQSGALNWAYMASGAIASGMIGSGQVGGNHLSSGSVIGQVNQFGLAAGSLSLINQTAAFSGSLCNAPATGLYRASVYTEITQGGLLNAGNLSVQLNWTSDAQAQTLTPVTGVALVTSGALGQSVSAVRALSGTPIIGTVLLGSIIGTPHYNAFLGVERVT